MQGDQYLSPEGMLFMYKNIECSVGGGVATVSVNKYRNAKHGAADKGGCNHALELRMGLLGVAPNTIRIAGGRYDVFTGKGSPWGIAHVLEDFYTYSDAFIAKYRGDKPGTPTGKCARILEDDTTTWEQTLQAICDEYFGLDCNGFAGNWLRIVQPDFKLTPDDQSNDILRKRPNATFRTRLEDVEYWDVMCYVGNEHVATINQRGSTASRFFVCQSAGGGPRMNELGIIQVSQKVFKLAAPTPQDIGNNFYIVNLWT